MAVLPILVSKVSNNPTPVAWTRLRPVLWDLGRVVLLRSHVWTMLSAAGRHDLNVQGVEVAVMLLLGLELLIS